MSKPIIARQVKDSELESYEGPLWKVALTYSSCGSGSEEWNEYFTTRGLAIKRYNQVEEQNNYDKATPDKYTLAALPVEVTKQFI